MTTAADLDEPTGRSPRDWAVDALLFVLAAGFTAVALVDSIDHGVAALPLGAELAIGTASCLGLWLRRRWPVGLAVVTGLLGVYAVTANGVALIALFTVATRRRPAVVVPVAVGFAVTGFLTPLVRPDTPWPPWWQMVLGFVVISAALAWGMFLRVRRELQAATLRERAQRAEAAQELRVVQARQQERNRIAREMHDVLAHRISLLSLHAGALELRPDAPPDDIARAAGVIRGSAHLVLEDLREVIGVLRQDRADDDADAPDRPQPTLADLPRLVEESRTAGMRITLECRVADMAAVPPAAGRNAYRIVQEGLTNARKHAWAAAVTVHVHGTVGDGLTVEVSNSASRVGVPDIPGSGAGLIGLAERAHLAGGRLEHGRTPDGDFHLRAWLPWPA